MGSNPTGVTIYFIATHEAGRWAGLFFAVAGADGILFVTL